MSGPWEMYQDGPWSQFAAPQADPKIGQPEDLTFAEKYIAPILDKAGSLLQNDRGAIGGVARTVLNDGNARGGVVGRLAMGAADPGVAIAQAVANLTPAGDAVNKGIQQTEQQYQDARKAAGSEGFDPARMAGNVGMAAFMTAAAPAIGPSNVLARGAAQGAALNALQPITDGGEQFWTDKSKQAGIGAIAGLGTSLLGAGLARVISPKASTDAQIKLLREEGVEPSLGQTLGGAFNRLEEKAQSLPFLGEMIQKARERGARGVEEAAFRRAAAPIGAEVTETGREGVAALGRKIGNAYEEAIPKLGVDALDPKFVDKLSSLRGLVKALPEREALQFDSILERELGQRMAPNGMITGQNLKDAWKGLRDQAGLFERSNDAYQSQLGKALKQAFTELKDHVSSSNSAADVAALRNADMAYAQFKRVQRAASYVGNEDGHFTPSQFQSAVKAMDGSKDKAGFARGDALMQDLADAGKSRLANKVPNSGSVDRASLIAAFMKPALAVAGAAGGVAYTAPVQNALRALVANRPEAAPRVANELRRLIAPATLATAPLPARARERKRDR